MQPGQARAIAEGTAANLFSMLGPRPAPGGQSITVFAPDAARLFAVGRDGTVELKPFPGCDEIFTGEIAGEGSYTLRKELPSGKTVSYRDPYSFGPVLGELDEHLIAEGKHGRLWEALGAHVMEHEGVRGTHFAVWAPNATRVSVVGPFNGWDGRRDVMRPLRSGLWEIFLPELGEGELYKYELVDSAGQVLPLKADPVGYGGQLRPDNASIVRDISGYGWDDQPWMDWRAARNSRDAPISIYEVHLGSWWRDETQNNRPISYKEAAEKLVGYAADMGFTHIELLPVAEHPFDGSWGYQPTGLYAPTVRHGPPHEFRDLVDAAHRKGLGILLDWVPAHFPSDAHGLAKFDGTPLYEYADPREGFHRDWNTLIYDFGRREVANFLIANASYWVQEYHVDGLRVDAVASMLYRDYSRNDGEWVANKDGGRENYEAIDLLQRMNSEVYGAMPGVMTVAEESTAFPKVSRPVEDGGLGFGFKWNMGWMHDTLGYVALDPIYRQHHHHQVTFGLTYAFSENFVLALSHDEVVHGKGSMLNKMPGEPAQKFATLRAYYGFMWGHPGKKLLFMGQEFGQSREWNFEGQLDWELLEDGRHAGVRNLVRDLNRLYRETPALHRYDCMPEGFEWLLADAAEQNVFAWLRKGASGEAPVVVVCNFSAATQSDFLLGLPKAGEWREILNSDAEVYGGSGIGNMGGVTAAPEGVQGQPASARLVLPPLSALMFTPAQG